MQTLVRDVLAAWREAERIAAAAEPGSDQRRVAEGAASRLHALYVELTRTPAPKTEVDVLRELFTEINRPLRPSGS